MFYLPAVLLGGAAGSPVAGKEKGLYRRPEFFQLCGRGDVLGKLRHQFSAYAMLGGLHHLIDIGNGAFAHMQDIARLNGFGRLGIYVVQLHLPALAGIGGLAAGLEGPDGPEVFVYSDFGHG